MAKRKGSVVDGLQRRLEETAAAAEVEVSGDAPAEKVARKASLVEVPLTAVMPNPANVRTTFDEDALGELAASITEIGIVQPLVVRPSTSQEKGEQAEVRYTILAGERRYRAARKAGLDIVPVVVRTEDQPDGDTAVMLIENLQREDLSPLEEALAFQRLIDTGMSQRGVASAVGKTQAHVSRRLSLLTLVPTLQKLVQVGELGVDVAAKDLARLPVEQQDLVVETMTERLDRGSTWASPDHVRAVVALVQDRLESQTRLEALRATIVEGAKEVSDAERYALSRHYERVLQDEEEIAQAAEEDRLAVVVSAHANRLTYLNTGPLAKADPDPVNQAERERMKRYRQTSDAIARWVEAHHKDLPKPGALVTRLAQAVIAHSGSDQLRLVHRWVGGLYGDTSADNEYVWVPSLEEKDLPTVAWLLTVADDLSQTRYSASNDEASRRTAERVAQLEQEGQE